MELVKKQSLNVIGTELEPCSHDPKTGFFRDGYCNTCTEDMGSHTVCVVMTDRFLQYSRFKGNDLSTPRPEFGFAGLKEGDQWCLCAARWLEAYEDGMEPKIKLLSTHQRALELVPLEKLKAAAIDLN
jgi:uncharacterized protein (DUF2237 family)